jgi:hypothetical protein
MAAPYVVGELTPEDAADGTSGSDDFAAFGIELRGELCGIATARVDVHPLAGTRGEIEGFRADRTRYALPTQHA